MKTTAKGMNAKDFNRAIMTLYDGIDNVEYFTPTRQISETAYDAAWDLINAHKEGDIVLNVPEFLTFLDDLEYEFYKEKVKDFNMFKRYINEIKERLTGESK